MLTTTVLSQKKPILVYDESGSQIKSFFYLDKENDAGCGPIKPLVGTIINVYQREEMPSPTYSVLLRTGKASTLVHFIELGRYPSHLQDNVRSFLLKKDNNIKVWGYICGSGGFITATHISKIEDGVSANDPPIVKDSILERSPDDAIQDLMRIDKEISAKIKKIKIDFDKEIAPNILTGPKGEFETTAEANARLLKLQNLRTTNNAKLQAKINTQTKFLVDKYLSAIGSVYTSPLNVILGRYNADTETFPLIKNGKDVGDVKVPRKIAPHFKQNFSKAITYIDSYIETSEGTYRVSPARIRVEYDGQVYVGEVY